MSVFLCGEYVRGLPMCLCVDVYTFVCMSSPYGLWEALGVCRYVRTCVCVCLGGFVYVCCECVSSYVYV